MKTTLTVVCFYVLLVLSTHSYGAEQASFEELASKNQKEIVIRGFLYTGQDGKIVLAREPNLKSCCIGSKSKMDSQILVYGDSAGLPQNSSASAITLQGYLTTRTFTDEQQNFIQLYELTNATVVKDGTSRLNLVGVLAGGLAAIGLLLWWMSKTKSKNSHIP